MIKKIASIIFLVSLSWSCIDPLDIEVVDDGSRLVVFAEITDQAEEYIVDLSRTANYESVNNVKVTEALVKVIDSKGNGYDFTEVRPGIYKSCPAEFIGQIGESYTLRINTQDEKIYESEIEEILPTGEIESVYFERFDRQVMIDGQLRPEKGLKLFCDFKDNPSEDYFRVDWEGTYQFRAAPMDSEHTFCWNTEYSKFDINLYEDSYTNNSLKKDFEITFLEAGFRFTQDYSFKAKLKSMSAGAYNFWRLIKQQYENDGSIFSALPAQINSNIKSITNPEEKVLGYFITSAEVSKRIRISPYDIGGGISTSTLPCRQFRPTDPLQEYCYDCTKFENSVAEEPTYW